MNKVEFMKIAMDAYPDCIMYHAVDAGGGEVVLRPYDGDGLATFIARELLDVFEEGSDRNVENAVSAIAVAVHDLNKVLMAYARLSEIGNGR